MAALTAYEQEQVRHIAGWKAEPPMLIVELFERLTHPLVTVAKQFLPENAVKDAITAAYKAAEVFAHKDDILQKAGVNNIRLLLRGKLEACDRLADEFAKRAGEGAMARGAVLGGAGGAGAVLGLEVMVTYALKTIHTIGYCYGVSPEDPHERDFALTILLISAAGTLAEKQHAMSDLQELKEYVAGEIVEDITKEAVEDLAEEAIEGVAQQTAEEFLSERLLESGALRAVPFLGILLSAVSDAAVAQYIGQTAKFAFQERWLQANGKVKTITPDPALARSRLQRAEGALSSGIYWTTFLASFVVTFPPHLLFSLVPAGSAVRRGFSDGCDTATHDAQQLAHGLRDKVRSVITRTSAGATEATIETPAEASPAVAPAMA